MKRLKTLMVAAMAGLALFAIGCDQGTTDETTTTTGTTGAAVGETDEATDETTDAAGTTDGEVTDETPGEARTYSIWTWFGNIETWGGNDYNEVAAFQVAEERTNVQIDWLMDSDTTTFDLIMASGDMPDAIYYAWNPIRQGQYAADGNIIPIQDYIASSAPNLQALIDSDETIQKQLVREDGSIYLTPWVTADTELIAGEGFAIREDWLEDLSLDVPANPQELMDVLKAFAEQDANGNGTADEIVSGYPGQFNKSAYAFGTSDNDPFYYAEDGETMVYGPVTEEYKNWLLWMNELWENNLIDPDYFSNDDDLYLQKVVNNRVGLYVDNPGVLNRTIRDSEAYDLEIRWLPMRYMEYEGESMNFSSAYKRHVQPYGLAITRAAEDPEGLLEWIDFWYTEEGSELLTWGVEGESFEVVDGQYQYTDNVLNHPELEPIAALSQYAYPTFVGVQSLEAVEALSDDLSILARETWADTNFSRAFEPFIAFNTDEQDINTRYRTDLNTIKDTWRDQFISGEADIEAEWDAYLAELDQYNVDELIRINQEASDRYLGR